jgi:hypothetical protein
MRPIHEFQRAPEGECLVQNALFAEDAWVSEVNPNDVVYTPDAVAKMIADEFKPTGRILEPCKGEGAFMRHLPAGSEWCEIREGRDFFNWKEPVDWIVSNPPYSLWDRWFPHSLALASNVVYLVPFSKVFKSMGTIRQIYDYGGIVKVLVMPAGKAGFPFGFPCGAFHFKRGYAGPIELRIVG